MGHEEAIEMQGVAGPSASSRSHAETARVQKAWLIVAAFAAAAALVRFHGLGSRALWLDEAYSHWFSSLGWTDLWTLTPRYETHPPTYYSILKLWREIAGDGAFGLRSLSALAGIAAIPIAAIAARELAGLTRIARPLLFLAIACALVAASPRLVMIGQDARPYALLLLAYAAGLAFWLRLTRAFNGGRCREGALADWAGLGASALAVLWLHGLGLLYAAALFSALILTAARSASAGRWLRLGFTAAITGICYLPCLLMMAGRTGDWGSGWLQWDPLGFPGALLDLFGLLRLEESATPVLARILMAVLIFLGLRAIWRSGERSVAWGLVLLIFLPPLAAAAISQLAFPIFLPRTLIGVTAPAYLAAAYGIAQLPARRLALAGGALALIFGVSLAETARRPSLEKWDLAAEVLKREMKPGDVIWTYPNDVQLPLQLALGRPAPIRAIPAAYPALEAPGRRNLGSPAVVTIDAPLARVWLRDNPAPRAGTIWLVWIDSIDADPDGRVVETLAAGRRKGRRREWDALTLLPLHPGS